ncbi:MAG: helix-turn-helix domain-containing protein [Lentisphaeria bacterium]|nr:helix-turn-helix domain-containing protein [Lentisphaeria bacterium]
MAALLEKFSYDAPARSGWHIRKNLLERTGYDNQDLLFYDYGRLSCTAGGENPMDKSSNDLCWAFHWIRSGSGIIICNQETWKFRKNDISIAKPDDSIRVRIPAAGKLEVHTVILLDSPVVRMLSSRLLQEKILHLIEPELIEPFFLAVEDLCNAGLKHPDKTILRDLAVQIYGLIAELSRQCLDFESKLTIQQIQTEFSCRPWNNWSLPELARKSGLSERSFERQFRKLCGCSWLQYLTGAKIGMASILLQTTQYRVDEIVKLCNFRSKPYFHQVFKRQTGATPLAYRGSWQNDKSSLASLFKSTREENILTANRKKILWLLLQNSRTTVSEIAGKMDIHRSAVQKNLDWLKARHYIRRQGSRRAGYWLILKSDIPKPD